jgi:UDPglucose--hexose-1-phosphate uridylyltransferase
LVFKNSGGKAGASIFHSHSQVFATEVLPPDVMEELSAAHKYQVKKGVCPYCKIIKDEEKSQRKIYADEHIVAIAPYASQFHYEAWIFPRRHLDNITLLSDVERRSFALALKQILSKLNSINLSYNYFLHDVVKDKNQHLYLKIQPRESIFAGVELGSGIVINSIAPEVAAKFYRAKNHK